MADGMQNEITPEVKPEIISESPIRWSENIGELAKALPLAQKALKPLEADATNKHLGKDYASLGAALDACLEAYNENGFSVIQIPTVRNDMVFVTTRILHESAEWLEADLEIKPENLTAQKIGTAAKYGRRYMLESVAGLAVVQEAPPAAEASQPAKKDGKRLTKAQSRDLYSKLQSGLRNQSSEKAVNKWLDVFDGDLKKLPVDFEKELRKEAQQEIEGHQSAKKPELEGAGF